jgi:hypothetical protein
MLTIQTYDGTARSTFNKKHVVDGRGIWLEILAKRGKQFTRFQNVCPFQCLDLAKALSDEGWTGIAVYAFYNTKSGTYEEATPWFSPTRNTGVTNGFVSLRFHCTCKKR